MEMQTGHRHPDRLAAPGDDRVRSLASRSAPVQHVAGDFQHLAGAVTLIAIAVAGALNDPG